MEKLATLIGPVPIFGQKAPGLLVSVRSVAEAAAALEGGAHLIDIKEPSRGPLGRADAATIDEVIRFVAKRRPVSAALGELAQRGARSEGRQAGSGFRASRFALRAPLGDLDYVKWGLAGCRDLAWRQILAKVTRPSKPRLVVVAYVDWQQAGAPPVDEVVQFALHRPGSGLLLDTYGKEPMASGRKATLLDWLSPAMTTQICRLCRQAGVPVALAGSLGADEVELLLPAAPDWFAVRAAACDGGQRDATVKAERVHQLVALLG